jgi:trans-aconitate methyltransferase
MEKRGIDVQRLRALDVYAGSGELLTRHYAYRVASIEAWERTPELVDQLRRNLPADATVKAVDSHLEITRVEPRSFDFVVVDNFLCSDEHFPLFPHLWEALSDQATLALNVLPYANRLTRKLYPGLLGADHLQAREDFFDRSGGTSMSNEELAAHYKQLAQRQGLETIWSQFVRRTERRFKLLMPVSFYVLVLHLRRAQS